MTSVEHDYLRYRTFWPRLGAVFLDAAALAPLNWADQVIWNSTSAVPLLFGWSIISVAVSLAYPIYFVAKLGQTPGKMACGVKIVSLNDSPVSLKQAVLREILGVLSSLGSILVQVSNIFNGHLANRALGSYHSSLWVGGIVLFLVFLEFVTMLTKGRRRAIHDFIAGTVVVRDSKHKQIWLLWPLITLFVLNRIIPRLLGETNLVFPTK
jgi:uncharacterized RDD family membrane protein YckC